MKIFTIILPLFVLAACGTNKEVSDEELESATPPPIEVDAPVDPSISYVIGEVHLNEDGCSLYISSEDLKDDLYPVSLDDMFKVDGAKLEFSFTPSRAPLPSGCESCKAVVLQNVTRMKG